jgi:hypothetical protein
VNLYLAAVEENRRLRILVLPVDRRDAFVHGRFAHAGDAKYSSHDADIARMGHESRPHEALEHGAHLARRAGQQDDRTIVVLDVHAGRCAVRIIQDFRALYDHRLTRVDLGHGAAHALEFRADLAQHLLAEEQPAPERARRYLARNVVFGRPESARRDNDARALERVLDGFLQPRVVVADDGLELDFDAQPVELFGQPETVRVRAIRRQEFRPYGYDFGCQHGLGLSGHDPARAGCGFR